MGIFNKLLKILILYFILVNFGYSLFEDFSNYNDYYKVIETCDGVYPLTKDMFTLTGDPSSGYVDLNSTNFKEGVAGFTWSKGGSGNTNSYFKGQNVYIYNISPLVEGYFTFWYYLPSGSASKVSKVEVYFTSNGSIGLPPSSPYVNPQQTTGIKDGWNYFKQVLKSNVSGTPDYNNMRSIMLGLVTNNGTDAISGIIVDDVKIIHQNGITNGVFEELGGVWSIVSDNGNYVYAQTGDCNGLPAVYKANNYNDFTYIAKVKFKQSSTSYGGIVFRYQNGNYYLFNMNNSNNKLEIKKYNGSFTDLSSYDYSINIDSYYYLKVICKGNNIKSYISTDGINWGNPCFDINDSSFSEGKVGLIGGGGTDGEPTKIVYFDDMKVLPTPYNLIAVAKENQVDLTWSILAGSGEISGYNIYRKDTSSGGYVKIGNSSGTSYSDTTAKGETAFSGPFDFSKKTYLYKVSANVSGLGESEFSNEVTAIPFPSLVVKMGTFTPTSSDSRFNKVTFEVYNPDNSEVELKIYDINATLVGSWKSYTDKIEWDGRDLEGNIKESGVYIYQVKIGNSVKGVGTVCLAR